jgi:glutathione S-transferase
MTILLYSDRLSQPCRACIIFCIINNIEYTEINISILDGKNKEADYLQINPCGSVPSMVDTQTNVICTESTSIIRYLSKVVCNNPQLYPNDIINSIYIDSVFDWYHSNIRIGVTRWVFLRVVVKALKNNEHSHGNMLPPSTTIITNTSDISGTSNTLQLNDDAIATYGELVVYNSLKYIENSLINNSGYITKYNELSIADILIGCEIEQLNMLEPNKLDKILESYPKVNKWYNLVKSTVDMNYDNIWTKLHTFTSSN